VARQRLGVVLLVPQPVATEIDGLRRALGDGALGRIAPHVTLVPPVNVAERDLRAAFAAVRSAAAACEPLGLRLGPVDTFAPVNPVAYLRVGGEPGIAERLDRLRTACNAGPLSRATEHEFVPHVTVADELAAGRLAAVEAVLGSFRAHTIIDRVHVLAEQPGRVWQPIADMPLGEAPAARGRGSLPLEVSTAGRPDVEAAALLSLAGHAAGLPFAVTARREGVVVGAAWGWSAGRALDIADLAVVPEQRGQGIGRHLVAAIEALARRRGADLLGATAPNGGPAAALLQAAGFARAPLVADADPGGGVARRWERRLDAVAEEGE
jgi:2'-5' RNA ligase/GNAT superfamily N-acetyltransferase